MTAPKLPDNLFTVTDIDAELSKVRDDESDFIAADFSRLICAETDFSLGGFYSFNGMNFYEYMGKKLHFMFGYRAFTYVSTEVGPAIKKFEAEQNEQVKKKGRKAEPETVIADSAVKKQEEFEAMKKKTRNMLLGLCLLYTSGFLKPVAGLRCRHTLSGFFHFKEVSHEPEHKLHKETQGNSGRNIQYEDGQHHLCHRRSFQQDEQGHSGG